MKLAFVFPGQGSQSLGMMQGYDGLPVVKETFAEASEILKQDFWKLVTEGPVEALNLTVNTQPVMLIAGVAAYRAWQSLAGVRPALMAGHSLGEYSALVAAEALRFADAVPLVRFRAEAMQRAAPEGTGAVAAILGLDDDIVRQVCAEAAQGQVLEPANFNSPAQVVIAGHREAVNRGMDLATAKGAKRAVMLPVSAPVHCSLMRPAAEQLRERLRGVAIGSPKVPVIHNVDVAALSDPEAIREALVRQVFGPVRWAETIQAFAREGVTHVVECGPGKVLAGLNKRIEAKLQTLALVDAESVKQAMNTLR